MMIDRDTAAAATTRLPVAGVEFAVKAALGMTIRGRFERVGGWYEVGPNGQEIRVTVEPASLKTSGGFWSGLLHAADSDRLAGQPEVRFTSTRVQRAENGTLRVEGAVERAGKLEPVAFDARVDPVGDGLRLTAMVTLDRHQLGSSGDRFAAFLPATVHVTVDFARG
jgi:polyisoprenoid-binding protein YceI